MTDLTYYKDLLDYIIERWLGVDPRPNPLPYRMLAVLLDDPWNDFWQDRNFIVDITNPEIQRKLDVLGGPYFNTIMRMLELRMLDENNEHNNTRTKNSSRTLV